MAAYTEKKKSIWAFGTKEVVYAAIGAALYAVLTWAFNVWQIPGAGNVGVRPAIVIPMFFGIAFGPIVGFITGFVGNILADMLSGYGFWIWWDLGNGIIGLIPGIFSALIVKYNETKSILWAELSVILGSAAGMGVASLSEIWVSGADMNTVFFANFLPAFVTNIIWGLVLLPLLMIAYAAILKRSGR
ncbi:MAG TPA: ECF transporter S component [Anaerolineaceae bacterium]|jgi:energy-coupling factor transport system substrate-specific component|nr:ECF transporter S component [Anaerolineaceae bacterium]